MVNCVSLFIIVIFPEVVFLLPPSDERANKKIKKDRIRYMFVHVNKQPPHPHLLYSYILFSCERKEAIAACAAAALMA